MAGKFSGFVNNLIMGKEKSETYARSTLPSNRWELFWDIFKGRFFKLVIVNLLTVLFCLPAILLIVFNNISALGINSMCSYGQSFGAGYMASSSFVGYSESISLSVNTSVMFLLPVALAIAAIGISGGAYIIRNMVWTEGIFVANDFWRGIKQNISQKH